MVASLNKMLHDNYLCLVKSGKQQIKEVKRKFNRKTWKQRQLLSESGFVLRIALPPVSRDRRIKMKKSINHIRQAYVQGSYKLFVDVWFNHISLNRLYYTVWELPVKDCVITCSIATPSGLNEVLKS